MKVLAYPHGIPKVHVSNIPLYLYGLVATWVLMLLGYKTLFEALGLQPVYAEHPFIFSLYFGGVLLLLVFLYPKNLKSALSRESRASWLALGAFLLVVLYVVSFITPSSSAISLGLDDQSAMLVQFLHFGLSYAIPKTLEIGVQQLFVVLFVTALYALLQSRRRTVLAFGIVFLLVHMPLVLIIQSQAAALFAIGSVVAGFLFPYLLLYFRNGFVYTFMLHWLFYLLIIMWFVQ